MSKLTAGYQSYTEDLVSIEPYVPVKAVELDGTNDFVDFGTMAITDNLGVSVLFECGSQNAPDYIIHRWAGANKSWAILCGPTDSRKIGIYLSDNGTFDAVHGTYWTTTDQVLPAAGWVHIFFSFASGTIVLKVDDVEITSFVKTWSAAATLNAGAGTLQIGRASYGFAGKVCGAVITDTEVPSAADATYFYSGAPNGGPGDPKDWTPTGSANLVSSWLWDRAHTYPTILDRTASGNDGTMTNMNGGDIVDTTFEIPCGMTPYTIPYKALEFTAAPFQAVYYGAGADLKDAVNFSCGGWYYHTGSTGTIFRDYDNVQNRYQFIVPGGATNKVEIYLSKTATASVGNRKIWRSTGDVFTVGAWHQWAFTFAANTPVFYVNGTAVAAWTKTEDSVINALFAGVGEVRTNLSMVAKHCNQWYADIVITAAQALELYGGGTPIAPEDSTATANMISAWIWDTSYPDIPGAGDVKDRLGANDGTTVTMDQTDVVDSPFTTPGLSGQTFSIADGFYADDEAFRAALEAAVQAKIPAIDIYKPGTLEARWLIEDSGAALFRLTWDSDNARLYMGFEDGMDGAAAYYSSIAVASTWYPLNGPANPVFSRIAARRVSVDHTGWSRSAVTGRHDEITVTLWIEQTEALNAFATLQRFVRGARGKLRLDATNANAWAWSAAAWDGEMIVSLADASKRMGFSNYLSRPWIGVKEITLDFVRWV